MVAGNEGGFELDARSGERLLTLHVNEAALWATTVRRCENCLRPTSRV